MKRAMVDLETMGNTSNSAIVQIGACYFDAVNDSIGDTFFCCVDLQSSMDAGMEVTASTIMWWLSQNKEAQTGLVEVEPIKLAQALVHLNVFLKKAREVWSHATFDHVILNHATNLCGMKPVYFHRVARDIRTLLGLTKDVDWDGVDKREGVHHNALDDAIFQSHYCSARIMSLRKL